MRRPTIMKNSITTEKTKMDDYLTVDAQKIEKMMTIKLGYLKGEISLETAKSQMQASFDHVTAQEFALGEIGRASCRERV